MKKLLMIICSMTLVFGMVGTASALSYSDVRTGDWWFTKSGGESASWTFDLDTDVLAVGDIGSEDWILSSVLGITFYDDERDRLFDPRTWEVAAIGTDAFDVKVGVDDGEATIIGLLLSVGLDHDVTVTISAHSGDFGITKLDLHGHYIDHLGAPAPVPEPATILLMGTGLLGLVAYSRKRLGKKS